MSEHPAAAHVRIAARGLRGIADNLGRVNLPPSTHPAQVRALRREIETRTRAVLLELAEAERAACRLELVQ